MPEKPLTLDEILARANFRPNPEQRKAIEHTKGPLLIKAGPGSGKTQVLVMRTLYLILGPEQVPPGAIVICTFTEKAAAQLRDRISAAVRAVAPTTDLSDLMVGTIHSICRRIIDEFLNHTPLKRGYQVLEDLTQRLFIFQQRRQIGAPDFGRRMGQTRLAGELAKYFNKITEEMIDPAQLMGSQDSFTAALGQAYANYVSALREHNMVDFAFLQRYVYDLALDPAVQTRLADRFTHFLIDEYQDTNYIQEQLMLRLAAPQFNIAVVGDDDQSLYRFRGATVRNLLEFPQHFDGNERPKLTEVSLTLNYRSHKEIVGFYDHFMGDQDWTGPTGLRFRFDKSIRPFRKEDSGYPAVVRIKARSKEEEAERVARFVKYLKEEGIIHDLNEVAILLTSVRFHAQPFMNAFSEAGIPYYAPRAKRYFDNEEVMAAVGAFVEVLDFYGHARGAYNLTSTWEYLDDSVAVLYEAAGRERRDLQNYLRGMRSHLFGLKEGHSGFSLLDIFYHLARYQPFSGYLRNEASARNLAIFSRLLAQFQQYYRSSVLYADSLEQVRLGLFNSFLHMLITDGMDEYEDPYDIFPSGHVQIMTIHQAKGLEFPVVIVGSLSARARADTSLDVILGPYYHRDEFEPENRIGEFDFLRKFYVAFSRAEHLLVLSAGPRLNSCFRPFLDPLADLDEIDLTQYRRMRYRPKSMERPKPSFSLTSDVLVYDTCPQQYLMLKRYEFQPSAGGQMFFGMLVHHTIEDCHKHILEHGLASLTQDHVERYFNVNYESLRKQGIHPIAQEHKEAALRHVTNYLANSPDILRRVRQAEVPVVVDKQDYYLTGIIDLLLGEDGKWELLDFKANRRISDPNHHYMQNYKLQLATYGRAIEEKMGIRPERFSIYWTGEEDRDRAYMPVAVSDSDMEAAHDHFDSVARSIMADDFEMTPARRARLDRGVCRECDFRWGCSHRTCDLPSVPWRG